LGVTLKCAVTWNFTLELSEPLSMTVKVNVSASFFLLQGPTLQES
jgi:hypothetical protein